MHHHLAGGDQELQQWIRDYGVAPALRLGEREDEALSELSERRGRDREDLLREAINLLLAAHQDRRQPPSR